MFIKEVPLSISKEIKPDNFAVNFVDRLCNGEVVAEVNVPVPHWLEELHFGSDTTVSVLHLAAVQGWLDVLSTVEPLY